MSSTQPLQKLSPLSARARRYRRRGKAVIASFLIYACLFILFLSGHSLLGFCLEYQAVDSHYSQPFTYPLITPSKRKHREKKPHARKRRTSMYYTSTPPLSPLRATSAPRSPHGARNIHVRSRFYPYAITCTLYLDGSLVGAQATISSILVSQCV